MYKNFLLFILVLAGIFIPAYAQAGQGLSDESLACLFARAEEASEIPGELLAAIAAQESKFHPWSINLAGQGFYPKDKATALLMIEQSQVKSFDVGIMQINSWWLPRFQMSISDILEPENNVLAGTVILGNCIKRHGILGGISCYHTGKPSTERGKRYARRVISMWEMLKKSE